MFDTLFTIGQAASALLLLYGGFLVLMPARKPVANAASKDELILKHIHNDA